MEGKKRDLSVFSKAPKIASSPDSWNGNIDSSNRRNRVRDYTLKEIEKILNDGDVEEKRNLSRNFYEKDGFYTRLIMYYATVINYNGLLIPNPSYGKSLTLPHVQKRYAQALEFLDKVKLQNLFTRFSLKALLDGCYYGVLISLDKNNLVVLDLPGCYCRSRFKDMNGNDIIEFNVSYFNTIWDKDARKEALSVYPKKVSAYYEKYSAGKVSSKWVQIPSEIGLCFSLTETGAPIFINVIPSIMQYEDSVRKELNRQDEEIRKIIVQKIPHIASNGELVFEPGEALEMHKGAVKMLSGNKNLSVLTSYADVDAIVSKTGADTVASSLEQMRQNIYSNAGASPQLFAPTGSQALTFSIKNDIAMMMVLANKYCNFTSWVLNNLFGNSNVYFNYQILPVGIYNQVEYVDEALKLAQNGYSILVPTAAMGISQHELSSLKELENDVLKLKDILIPLSSSYTESNKPNGGKVGRPTLPLEQKSQKTIQNEDAIDNQGGA